MTDKELFEKTEKQFNLKKNSKVNKVFEEGSFNKVLNEIKGPKRPSISSTGFLSRVAAAIPGTRGHKIRSAAARKASAEAKKAEIEARIAQQKLMKGKDLDKVDYKVNDTVLVKTKKGGKKQAILSELLPDGRAKFILRDGPTYVGKQEDIIGKVEQI